MSEELETGFIQHARPMTVPPAVIDRLFRNDYVFIHYVDDPITVDPNEYEQAYEEADDQEESNFDTAAEMMERLNGWARSGKLVGADYSASPNLKGGMKVGKIEPAESEPDATVSVIGCRGSEVVDILDVPAGTGEDDIWQQASGKLQEVFEEARDPDTDSHIYKGVQLDDARWVWYRDYPVLGAWGRMPVVCEWGNGDKKVLRTAYEGEEYLTDILGEDADYEERVRFLDPRQLEMVCAEYLRQEYRNFLQLYNVGENLPPGFELRDIDIVGQSYPSETGVVAQVTHETDADELSDKLKKLAPYARTTENARLVFFGPLSGKKDDNVDIPEKVEYIPNSEVYEKIEELKPELLDAMLTVPPAEETEGPL